MADNVRKPSRTDMFSPRVRSTSRALSDKVFALSVESILVTDDDMVEDSKSFDQRELYNFRKNGVKY